MRSTPAVHHLATVNFTQGWTLVSVQSLVVVLTKGCEVSKIDTFYIVTTRTLQPTSIFATEQVGQDEIDATSIDQLGHFLSHRTLNHTNQCPKEEI